MTKKELQASLESGKTMGELFHFTDGQDCQIYKADAFADGEHIIYIPDTVLNGVPVDKPLPDSEEICQVVNLCYTGSDFMDCCGGNRKLALNLFAYCDWQHPSSALPEIAADEDEPSQERVEITIFQAPLAVLIEKGLYWQMHSYIKPFHGDVPSEYYLAVFNGTIDCPEQLPEDPEQRRMTILERIYAIFNREHPVGYLGRSLSVGDVVQLEGRYYLCAGIGFVPILFASSHERTLISAPAICELSLPDGTKLRASTHGDTDYLGINIDLLNTDGTQELICFAEHNPEKSLGHRLCIGVYQAGDDEPVYYNSYHLIDME